MEINWNIRKIVKKGDYLYAVVPEHPKRTDKNYVLMHRVVVENSIGRLLKDDEIIHHKNEDKHDNRVENLEITTVSKHSTEHGLAKGRKYVKLKCPNCATKFEKPHNSTHLSKPAYQYTFCNRICAGTFTRNKQLSNISYEELKRAADDNVIEVYRKFAPIPERTSNA